MLKTVDEDEKVVNNVYTLGGVQEMRFLTEDNEDEKLIGTIFLSGQNRQMWFLTEDGLIFCYRLWPIANLFFDYILYI